MLVIINTVWVEDVCVYKKYTEKNCLETHLRISRITELNSLVFVQVVMKLNDQ